MALDDPTHDHYPLLYFPPAIDSTMLSCFDACAQKWFLEFCLRKVPVGRSIHLHAGGCFAKALETVRRSYYCQGLPYEDCLLVAFEEFLGAWELMDPPPSTRSYKDFTNTWGAVEAYFREYPLATDFFQPYIKDDGEPAVEFKFAIPTSISHPITGDPILFAGRADQIAYNSPNVCYVMDEKTTGAIGPSWPYQWGMRGQFYGYTFAAKYMGFPCVGALVRGVAIQQTQYVFAEQPLLFTDAQLMRWWATAQGKIAQMGAMFRSAQNFLDMTEHPLPWRLERAHNSFPLSFGEACSSYGGCQYANDVCKSLEPWEAYGGYETRIWNPLEEDPTAESENRLAGIEPVSWEDAIAGL